MDKYEGETSNRWLDAPRQSPEGRGRQPTYSPPILYRGDEMEENTKTKTNPHTDEESEEILAQVDDLMEKLSVQDDTIDQLTSQIADLNSKIAALKEMNRKLALTGGAAVEKKKTMEEILYEGYGKH